MMQIPLSSPDITELEIRYVCDVLKTPHLSLGPKLVEFESKMADYIGTKYAIAVNSGTSGLHLCVKALGIGEGDEVITTPFSFIASANCLLYERAIPVFVDVDPMTLNIDVRQIEARITKKTKAILPVHVFGQPCEMDEVLKMAKKYSLYIIEDACEAMGAKYRGKKTGTWGNCGVFAFYPNKQMTTGEGGMIVTNDEQVARLSKSLRNQGRAEDGSWLAHERLGYNYRLSDINCALGIAQLERLEEMLARREKVAQMYNQKLKGLKAVITPYISPNVKASWFVYVIRLTDSLSKRRGQIINILMQKGINCSNYFPPIHIQPFYVKMFGYKKGDFPVTERASERTIALPFYNNLREEQIDYVVNELKCAIG